MPVINLNNILFTGKVSLVPTIVGAQFTLSQTEKELYGVTSDFFGYSVAMSGNDAAVGAWNAIGAPSGTTRFGYVRLFNNVGGDWQDSGTSFQLSDAERTANGTAAARFGWTVAMSSEWLVIGAANYANVGRVFVYRKVNGVWNTTTFATLTPTTAGTMFGYSVAIDGNTIAVGHQNANSTGTANGQVDVFVFNGTSWNYQASITPPTVRVTGQRVGSSVTISGNTIASGGTGNAGGTGQGQVIVSTRSGSTWGTPQVIEPSGSDRTTSDAFGFAVRLKASKLLISSPGAISPEAGRVFIFTKPSTTWTQEAKLSVTTGAGSGTIIDGTVATGARVGTAVECNDDCSIIFASATAYATNIGAAYVFEKVAGTWQGSAINNNGVSRLDPADKLANGTFGQSLQYNNGQLLVGAPRSSTGPGAFYVYK